MCAFPARSTGDPDLLSFAARRSIVHGLLEVELTAADGRMQVAVAAEGSALMARMLAPTQAFEALPVPTLGVVGGLDLTIGFELVAESPVAGFWQRRLWQLARSRP